MSDFLAILGTLCVLALLIQATFVTIKFVKEIRHALDVIEGNKISKHSDICEKISKLEDQIFGKGRRYIGIWFSEMYGTPTKSRIDLLEEKLKDSEIKKDLTREGSRRKRRKKNGK